MVFALRTYGFGYAQLEKSYCIMNMRRPMAVVNFDKITKIISRVTKRIAKGCATATLFRIKQSLKVFSHMQFKRFDKENKENYLDKAKKYDSETEKNRRL